MTPPHSLPTFTLRVADVRDLTPLIRQITLRADDGRALPGYTAGAHIRVQVALPDQRPSGDERLPDERASDARLPDTQAPDARSPGERIDGQNGGQNDGRVSGQSGEQSDEQRREKIDGQIARITQIARPTDGGHDDFHDSRHYSLVNLSPQKDASAHPAEYVLAVRREDAGRGGSRFMHGLQVGQRVTVEAPRNEFAWHAQDASAGANTGTNTITSISTNVDAGTGTGTNAGADTSANADTGTGTNTGTRVNTGTSTDTNTGIGANATAGTNTSTSANTGTSANAGTNTRTSANIDTSTDANIGTGANANASTSTDTNIGIGANATAGTNPSTSTNTDTSTNTNIGIGTSANADTRVNPGTGTSTDANTNTAIPGTVLLAGGIGITPLASLAAQCLAHGAPVRMVYAGRSRAALAYLPELHALLGDALRVHADDEAGSPLNVDAVLDGCAASDHLYVCGPKPLLDAVLDKTHARGWARERVHFEVFAAPVAAAGDHPFEVVLAQSGRSFTVPADKSILDVLIDAGCDPLYDCQRGECGVCAAPVIEGEIDHRDYVLSDAEKAASKVIHVCVSRCKGARLVLDM